MNRHIVRRAWLLLRNLLLFGWFNVWLFRLAVFLPYFALVLLPWFLLRGYIYAAQVKVKSMRGGQAVGHASHVQPKGG
jgi:hypothetical protein